MVSVVAGFGNVDNLPGVTTLGGVCEAECVRHFCFRNWNEKYRFSRTWLYYMHPIATLVVVSNTKGIKNFIGRYVVSWHPTSTGLI